MFIVSDRPRILVIGQDPATLALVTEEVAACGYDVTARSAESAEAGEGAFDLIAIGGGVTPERRAKLHAALGAAHPGARFLSVYGPFAASQIVATARKSVPTPLVDLEAYLDRIAYRGPIAPTLETLAGLQTHHIAAIPFEAIDVLLDRRIDITPEAVDAKLIGGRRGGYCFEQNSLFKRVLRTIGLEVEALLASVRWNWEPGVPPPSYTHQALRVTIDGRPWLVDVGFGSSVPPAPLRLDVTDEQPTSKETYRTLGYGLGRLVQADLNGRWQSLYVITPEPVLDGHFEIPNWFTATHPNSHFRTRLIVTRAAPEARYALLENRLTIRRPDGSTEQRDLDADGLEQALRELFRLEPKPGWRPLLERAVANGTPPPVAIEPQVS
jgi:N-hydroxyarylamine O-acetyltransferase